MKALILVLVSALVAAAAPFNPLMRPNPPAINIQAVDQRAAEAGNDSGHFIIRRSHDIQIPLRVLYRAGGTAINGVDYERLPESVVIPAGRKGVSILVRPIDDTLAEGRESVSIQLVPPPPGRTPPSYRIAGNHTSRVTIFDNDRAQPAEWVLLPRVTGTVAYQPELDAYSMPIGAALQSSYMRNNNVREFRRAFLEFQIPALSRHILSARLRITDGSPTVDTPRPEDLHDVSYYPADLAIGPSDYTIANTFFWAFNTDANVSGEGLDVDVKPLVSAFQGAPLGFRIKLGHDPAYQEFNPLGAQFQGVGQASPPHILITSTERPWIAITWPGNNSTFNAPTNLPIHVVTIDQDGYTPTVEFWANGEKIGQRGATHGRNLQRFSMVWSNAPPGIHALTATTVDNQGATAASAPVMISVGP